MTRLLTTTAVALTLVTGTAFAQTETGETNGEQVEQNLENAGDSMENAGENAVDATENAAEDATRATENAANDMMDNASNMIRARDILGGTIYSANVSEGVAEFETVTYESVGEDWEQIGEIEDIALSTDGQVKGIVAEIGGFLGIGDKHVLITMDNVKLVPVEDASLALVVGYSQEQLEQLPGVDEAFWN